MKPPISRRFKWSELTPFPNNPISDKRLERMRANGPGYNPALVGGVAVFDNSARAWADWPPETAFVGEGNHRRELAVQDGHADDEGLTMLLYRGLTLREMHELRRKMNDKRTVKPVENFLHRVVEDPLGPESQIVELVESLGWTIGRRNGEHTLSCSTEIAWIWNQNHKALVAAIGSFGDIFGTSVRDEGAVAACVKGLGAFWAVYADDEPNAERLAACMRGQTTSQLKKSGESERDSLTYVKNLTDGIRISLAKTYNKGYRGKKLPIV